MGRAQVVDPDAPARGRARPTTAGEREHFIDTDERLTFADEEYGEPYEEAQRRARVSWSAVFGLVFGVIGLLAGLTGALAPVALLAGAIGLLLALGGLAATGHNNVASRPLAMLGLLVSLAALVLAALAIGGGFEWLNRDDQAGRLRDWLDARLPWLENW